MHIDLAKRCDGLLADLDRLAEENARMREALEDAARALSDAANGAPLTSSRIGAEQALFALRALDAEK
jgi:hypothetical protein